MKYQALLSALVLLVFTSQAPTFAQGPLTPPGPPAPTMKSLQEIWDKIGGLETQVAAQQQIIQSQHNLLTILAANDGVSLPWKVTTIDAAGDVGRGASLAFTAGGQPAVSYTDATNGDLKYAEFNGTSWTAITVDSAGGTGTGLAFSPSGDPAISYIVGGNTLRYVRRTAGTWGAPETIVHPGPESNRTGTALAFSPSGQPAYAYSVNDGAGAIYITESNGLTWSTSVQAIGGGQSGPISLSYSHQGVPFVTGSTALGKTVKIASRPGIDWIETVITTAHDSNFRPSLAFNSLGQPAVCYTQTDGTVRFAVGDSWTDESFTVHSSTGIPTVTSYPSIAFGPSGQASVAFHAQVGPSFNSQGQPIAGDGGLRFAIRRTTGWTQTIVALGSQSNIKHGYSASGQGWIVFYDEDSHTLKAATQAY